MSEFLTPQRLNLTLAILRIITAKPQTDPHRVNLRRLRGRWVPTDRRRAARVLDAIELAEASQNEELTVETIRIAEYFSEVSESPDYRKYALLAERLLNGNEITAYDRNEIGWFSNHLQCIDAWPVLSVCFPLQNALCATDAVTPNDPNSPSVFRGLTG